MIVVVVATPVAAVVVKVVLGMICNRLYSGQSEMTSGHL